MGPCFVKWTWVCLVLSAGRTFVFAAPPGDLIGSLARAQYQCSRSSACTEAVLDPIQPELADSLRTALQSTLDAILDFPSGRRLKCQTFTNPVIDSDFPDPSQPIVGEDGHLYSYATNSLGYNVQYATASQGNIGSWRYAGKDALPDGNGFPSWADSNGGYTWAPAVMEINGVFNMYYTAQSNSLKTQCIGRAISSVAAGPFRDTSSGPIVCQPDLGGTIDAQPFKDSDGTLYLLYKSNGDNGNTLHNIIWIQELSADGSTLQGSATQLLIPDAAWENTVTEAPFLQICQGGKYCLFYSGYPYNSCNYATGVATASSVTGPYTKDPSNPVLAATGSVCGPGGSSLFVPDAEYSLIHTWNNVNLQYRALSVIGLTDDSASSTGYYDTPTYGASTCQ
ncbi:hypothetical protein WJX74_005656 [Apatococcus lobatus]|uniref:Glycoside hydrolase family 43 protein n=1 Tax=Apatococcus lobatus TaxID=904363 RepID=A0AAW1Q271_9CHLO